MTHSAGSFCRDASGRLCVELHAVDSLQYPDYATRIADHFGLVPVGDLVVGFDEMFRDYTDEVATVGIEWDFWSGLIIVAKTDASEPLVHRIAEYLGVTR
ncbi:MAG: hypothetical protein KDB14_31625 [Planctomycetales bacterium]|nr:hypothetical protein [Planctomycetales bacterium]